MSEWTSVEVKTESGESVFHACLGEWIVGPAFPGKEQAEKFAHFMETQDELKTYLHESARAWEKAQRERPPRTPGRMTHHESL